jgi:hypothetical protein
MVYVPVRPIYDYLSIGWSAQRQRINRDPILAPEARPGVVVTTLPGQPDQRTGSGHFSQGTGHCH